MRIVASRGLPSHTTTPVLMVGGIATLALASLALFVAPKFCHSQLIWYLLFIASGPVTASLALPTLYKPE